jgi:endonuclease I
MRYLYSIILSVSILLVKAQAPSNYYNAAAGLSGTALRLALHNIIDNHSVQSYTPGVWNAYSTTDILPGTTNTIYDIYSQNSSGTAAYYYTKGTDQCGNYSVEGDCYNREHSWPKSWFNNLAPMYSDIFHLYPTDGKVNAIRSNFPYGEVSAPTTTSTNGSKLGPCTYPGYTGTVFEPIDRFKGDLARTYFYMSTRYYTEDAAWGSSGNAVKCELTAWTKTMLLQWHIQDPVDAKEISRNNALYAIQGNRNPFVDSAQYANQIFGTALSDGELLALTSNLITVFPNPVSNDELNIQITSITSDPVIIYVSDISGKIIYNELFTNNTFEPILLNTQKFNNGIYYVKAVKGNISDTKRVVVIH